MVNGDESDAIVDTQMTSKTKVKVIHFGNNRFLIYDFL